MSATIEERVTKLVFDAGTFGTKIQGVLNQLAQLKEGLKLEGAQKGLQEVSDTANRFSLDGMKNQLSGIMGHFSALQVAAITALSNIVNRAVEAGLQIAKSLTIAPVMDGFREYETNLNSIQTILANTGLEGAAGLAKVTGKLDELNHYSDQTIYNFSEMAKNIGTFTAAGVDLDRSTAAIKGIANLAAVSGSNSQQASTAMYQLSQALSAGKVSLEDWNSVVNAGMGGKVFRDSLIETAKVHGVKVDEIIKKQGSFRNSIQEGWITTDILAETLSKFTGDLSDEQLKSLGYTKEQIAGIQKMGKTATDAATKVKTMTQLLDTLREGVTSGWAKTWQIVFGDFDEARGMFTDVSNVLGGAINQMSDARNELLQGWKDLGGRDALIDGIANAFQALLSVLRPIGQAFREMFPAATAQDLYNLTVAFRDFMGKLKIGEDTANNLRRTFAGLFAILGIGWDLLKAGVKFIADLIGKLTEGSGGILRFTGGIGDWLVALRRALQEGKAFTKFFAGLSKVLDVPIKILRTLGSLLGQLFDKLKVGDSEQAINSVTKALKPLGVVGEKIAAIWNRLTSVFDKIGSIFMDLGRKIVQSSGKIGEAVAGFISDINFDDVLKGVGTGALAALALTLRNFLKNFSFFGGNDSFLAGLKDALEAFTGALKGMQNALNAAALLAIAAAIGILTLSIVALSKIDTAGLIRASSAIAVMMGELVGAFILFDKFSTGLGAVKVGAMAAGFILLATAIRILASSVAVLADLSWEELAKGLTGVVVLLAALSGATQLMNADAARMVSTGAGLVLLAAAIRILVTSVQALSGMNWEELAKGLGGVAVLLGSLALFTKFADANAGGIAQGAGIILLAVGLKILASAVGDFIKYNWEQLARGMAGIAAGLLAIALAIGFLPPTSLLSAAGVLLVASSLSLIADGVAKMSKMSWGEIGRGLTVMAGALLAIALAIGFLPPTSLLSAAAILVVATSLGMIQQALGKMGGMSWEEIGKGLVVLAGSLLIIAAALYAMQTTISGAIAVTIAAFALTLLVPVLQALGDMSWGEILKGLAGLAGIFLVLGIAGVVLGPLAPVIISLAGAIALLGLGVLAAGVGVLAFATALGILATVGTAATAAIVGIVAGLIGLIPMVMEQIGLGLIAFAQVIAKAGPAILEAITTVLVSLLDAVIKVTPKIVELLKLMLEKMIDILVEYIPKLTDAGFKILIGFLRGVADNIGRVVDVATDVIVNFINGIGRNLPRITQAGVDLIINYINGLAQGIRDNSARVGDAGFNLASALVEGAIKGIKQFASRAIDAAASMAKDMGAAAMRALGVNSPSKVFAWISQQVALGAELGIDKFGYLAVNATEAMGNDMIDSMSKTLSALSSALGVDLIDFNPTISPVLDLSSVKKEAESLNAILAMPALNISGTVKTAKNAGSEYENNRRPPDGSDGFDGSGGTTYNFTQNNTSPKALPPAEIYRNTNNIISRATADKGV
jgi:tape measure domain-containing protein